MLASIVWSFDISPIFGFAGHEMTLSDTVRPDGCFIAIPSSLRSSVDDNRRSHALSGRLPCKNRSRSRKHSFLPAPPSHSEAADPCQRILGDWGWFIGGKVSFSQNAQAKWTPGSAGTPPASATWSCDPRSGTYTVKWQNGFVDTLRLSEDGAQLNGTSSTGVKVSGRRTPSAAGTLPPQRHHPNAKPLPAPNGSDGWTPMGPAGFGKQAPVPMGPGGVPQRIGPQGPPPKGSG